MSDMATKSPPEIRLANAADIDTISEIENRCFTEQTAYTKQHLEYLALKANNTCLIESQGDTARGFAIVTYRKRSQTGHIETIDVDPTFQNQGIGMRLLTAAEDDMKKRGMTTSQLEVSERNVAALKLYKKAGYTFKEHLKRYYLYNHNGTRNALRLVKSLQ
jgi:ribosomal-protein-alanine N-acetyltransferase